MKYIFILLTLFLVSCGGGLNQFVNGKPENGQGTFIYHNGKYEGEWKDRKRHGQGTFIWDNGDKYIGEWKNDKRHGQGARTFALGKYVGEFKDDIRNGQGTYTFANGQYVGKFKNNVFHGKGVLTTTNGYKYEGEWANFKRHGQGSYTSTNGVLVEGEWVRNIFVPGQNPLDVYVGDLKNGNRHGQGTYTYAADGSRYVGEWKDGKFHGQGTYTWSEEHYKDQHYPSFVEYSGNWKDGMMHDDKANVTLGNGEITRVMPFKNGIDIKTYLAIYNIPYIEPVEVYEEPIGEKVIVDKMDIGEAKLQCKDIGFTEGTESFGQCVLDLTK